MAGNELGISLEPKISKRHAFHWLEFLRKGVASHGNFWRHWLSRQVVRRPTEGAGHAENAEHLAFIWRTLFSYSSASTSFFNDKDFDYIKSVIQSTIVHLKKQNQINSVQLQFLMSLNFQELLKHHGNVFTEVHDTLDKIKSEKLQRKKT